MLPFLGPLLGRGKLGNFLIRNKWRNYDAIRALQHKPMLMLSAGKVNALHKLLAVRMAQACFRLLHVHQALTEHGEAWQACCLLLTGRSECLVCPRTQQAHAMLACMGRNDGHIPEHDLPYELALTPQDVLCTG
jgi:hypothetical protein